MMRITRIGIVLSTVLLMCGAVFGDHLESYGITPDRSINTHLPTPIWNLQYRETLEDKEILAEVEEFLQEKTCEELFVFEEKLSSKIIDLEVRSIYDGRMTLVEHDGILKGVLTTYHLPIHASEMNLPNPEYRREILDQSNEAHQFTDNYGYSKQDIFYYNIFDNQIEYVLYKVYDLLQNRLNSRYTQLYPDITSTELNLLYKDGFEDQELKACANMRLARTGWMMAKKYELAEIVE